jgi:hypothetical protein
MHDRWGRTSPDRDHAAVAIRACPLGLPGDNFSGDDSRPRPTRGSSMRPIARPSDGRWSAERARCDLGPCRPTSFLNVRQSRSSQMVSRKGCYRPLVQPCPVNLIAVQGPIKCREPCQNRGNTGLNQPTSCFNIQRRQLKSGAGGIRTLARSLRLSRGGGLDLGQPGTVSPPDRP